MDLPGRSVPAGSDLLARWPSLPLLLVGLFLPNAVFATGTLLGIALPYRLSSIAGFFTIALLARHITPRITIPLYLACTACDLTMTVSAVFHFNPSEMLFALKHLCELHLDRFPAYIVLASIAVALTATAVHLLKRGPPAFHSARLGRVTPLMAVAMIADIAANSQFHYHFAPLASAAAPFRSAATESGFRTTLLRNVPPDKNALLVIIEGWGEFKSAQSSAAIEAPLLSAAIRDKYAVTRGTTTYFGSTTAAEMRELCSTRTPYAEITSALAHRCLPHELRGAGYRTIAAHGFTNRMFDRADWIPRIGFATLRFYEEVRPRHTCGAVFAGACDRDMAKVVQKELQSASSRSFVYWLTLNSHMPLQAADSTGHFRCNTSQRAFSDTNVCWMAELWHEVFASIADIASDPATQPLEILIVGDHPPPLWHRAARQLFRTGEVPWMRLTPLSDSVSSEGNSGTHLHRAGSPGRLTM